MTDLSTVRMVDSIPSSSRSSTWCDPNGCLEIVGKIHFSMDCPVACQLRKINQIDDFNPIEPPVTIKLNSTLSMSYLMEIDAFTVVVIESKLNKTGNMKRIFFRCREW